MAVKGEHISISEQYQNLEQQVLTGRLESLLQLLFKRQIGQPLSSAEQQTIQSHREALLRKVEKDQSLTIISPSALQQVIDKIHSQLVIRLHKDGHKGQLSPSLLLRELSEYVHEQVKPLLQTISQLPTISIEQSAQVEEDDDSSLFQWPAGTQGVAAVGMLMGGATGAIQHLNTPAQHIVDQQAVASFLQQQVLETLEHSIVFSFDQLQQEEPTIPTKVMVAAQSGFINLRQGPGTNTADIGDLEAGLIVDVVGAETNANNEVWYHIQRGNRDGWVLSTLVKEVIEVPIVDNVELTTRERWDKEEIDKLLPGGNLELLLQDAEAKGITNIQYNSERKAYQGELNGKKVYFYFGMGTERGRDGTYKEDDLADGWVKSDASIRTVDFEFGKKGLEIHFSLSLNHPKYERLWFNYNINPHMKNKILQLILEKYPRMQGCRIMFNVAADDITPHLQGRSRSRDEGIGNYVQWNLGYGVNSYGFSRVMRVSLPDRKATNPRYDDESARRVFNYEAFQSLIVLMDLEVNGFRDMGKMGTRDFFDKIYQEIGITYGTDLLITALRDTD